MILWEETMGQRVTAVLFLFFFFSLPLFSQNDPIYSHGLYALPFFPEMDLTGKSRRTLGEEGGIHLRLSWDIEKLSTTLGQVEGVKSYSGEGERSLPGRVELLAGGSRGGLLLTLGRALPLYETSLKAVGSPFDGRTERASKADEGSGFWRLHLYYPIGSSLTLSLGYGKLFGENSLSLYSVGSQGEALQDGASLFREEYKGSFGYVGIEFTPLSSVTLKAIFPKVLKGKYTSLSSVQGGEERETEGTLSYRLPVSLGAELQWGRGVFFGEHRFSRKVPSFEDGSSYRGIDNAKVHRTTYGYRYVPENSLLKECSLFYSREKYFVLDTKGSAPRFSTLGGEGVLSLGPLRLSLDYRYLWGKALYPLEASEGEHKYTGHLMTVSLGFSL